jgi:hypothetical protein
MKITVRQLRRVIAEEVQRVLESSEYQQGLVYNNPDLEKQEISPFNLDKYQWKLKNDELKNDELENDERVMGTLNPTAENGRILAQIMATNPDKNIRVIAISPSGKEIEFPRINDGRNNYFVGDIDGLARYFKMKGVMFLFFGLCTPNGGGVP